MTRMSLTRLLAPADVRFLIDNMVGVAISSDNSSGEGIDFKVISVTKTISSVLQTYPGEKNVDKNKTSVVTHLVTLDFNHCS